MFWLPDTHGTEPLSLGSELGPTLRWLHLANNCSTPLSSTRDQQIFGNVKEKQKYDSVAALWLIFLLEPEGRFIYKDTSITHRPVSQPELGPTFTFEQVYYVSFKAKLQLRAEIWLHINKK